MSETADLLIIGAGCAGLALAARLHPAGRRVLILEPREAHRNDRTWCFWAPEHHEMSELIARHWTGWHLDIAATGTRHHHVSTALPYQVIPAERYYDWALARIASNRDIVLQRGVSAGPITPDGTGFLVETDAGRVHALQIVDTRPARSQLQGPPLLEQVFAGKEIEAVSTPGTSAGVMEHMRHDRHGFAFDYILPLAEGRVLVEATRFAEPGLSMEVLNRDLDLALARRGWAQAAVVRNEAGRLPMGLPASRASTPDGWVEAGIAGGGLRASSGYGFLRIQAWARHCAGSVRRHGRVMAHPAEPGWRRWMDQTFLSAIKARPEAAPGYFSKIAGTLDGDGFARFMSDNARLSDWARIVSALPPAPLMQAALRPAHARTGS